MIFDRQQQEGSSNVEVAWRFLGCPDNVVPRIQKKVGAKPSALAREKNRCKSAACRIEEIAEIERGLAAEKKKLLEEHDDELAQEEAELEAKLEKIKAARGRAQ